VAQTCLSRSAAFLTDQVQGPLTYKAGPRYACFATGAIVRSRSHRAPLVRRRFACAFPRPAEGFDPRRRQREGVESVARGALIRGYMYSVLASGRAAECVTMPHSYAFQHPSSILLPH
jgi:hypothetical protein